MKMPSENYKLLYTKTAAKDIQKLDRVVKKRLKKKLEEYSQDPVSHAKRPTNTLIGTYRFRIGNYRVVFDIEGNTMVILRVGHRSEIYRK